MNSLLPWIPKIFHSPILSEQLKLNDLLEMGKSSRPGFVRRQFYLYFSEGIGCVLKNYKGLAPENMVDYLSTKQSPQKISDENRITRYWFFK